MAKKITKDDVRRELCQRAAEGEYKEDRYGNFIVQHANASERQKRIHLQKHTMRRETRLSCGKWVRLYTARYSECTVGENGRLIFHWK